MSILWTIIIGFAAGVIARFFHPGNKYEPTGVHFDHLARDCWSFCSNIRRPGDRVV
jgi:hypothetical protein